MISIDLAHAHLIDGLVRSFKPQNILELGFGGGRSHNAIASGAAFNQNKPHYTLVDSWHDWNFVQPVEVHETVRTHALNHVTKEKQRNTFESFSVVTSTEEDFVAKTLLNKHQYDFIMSDADHQHTHQWCADVYHRLLTSPGILVYHDVSEGYDNLKTIKPVLKSIGGLCMEFNRSTREDEECQRGLLVVYKA